MSRAYEHVKAKIGAIPLILIKFAQIAGRRTDFPNALMINNIRF